MSHFLQNLNGNLLCSIDLETTGERPGYHDIIEVAVIPLDGEAKPCKDRLPFLMNLAPLRPENASEDAMRVNKTRICEAVTRGIDPFVAADRFVEWFDTLKLGYNKRIAPLGCNYPFDKSFLLEWLGYKTYDLCFYPCHRDVQTAAIFMNDMAGWRGQDFYYPKVNLSYLCTHLKIQRYQSHTAVDDARVTAEIYRRMVQRFLPG